MRSRFSGLIPIPVSSTVTLITSSSGCTLPNTLTCPECVNFSALVTRLYITWVDRCASASISGKHPTSLRSLTPSLTTGFPLLSMECWQRTRTSSTMLAMFTMSRENFIFLSCTSTDASMMLLTMSRSLLAQLWMSCIGFCSASSILWFSLMELERPMIPCSGDLSSWLTIAMKLDFFCSISLIVVMSWPTQITPMISPLGFSLVVAFSSRQTGFCPEHAASSTSKFDVRLPMAAC
mmetsp:Transcript_89572/g.253736  ORF Transcript_89572/g.253736 Transcript_89572/m.253736 type:complete len:236 (+) Transcript_89572:1987-2694(+)